MPAVAVWLWGLAAVPTAWLVLFGLFIVRGRLTLGRWPAPYDPDPKSLGFGYHHVVVVGGMPLTFGAVLCVVGLTLLTYRDVPRPWAAPTFAILSLAALLLLANADPGFLFTWVGD